MTYLVKSPTADAKGLHEAYIVKCDDLTTLRHWIINHLDISIQWIIRKWNPINKQEAQ